MDIATRIIYLIIMVIVIAWLVFELYLDWKSRQSWERASPDPQKRLPPRLD